MLALFIWFIYAAVLLFNLETLLLVGIAMTSAYTGQSKILMLSYHFPWVAQEPSAYVPTIVGPTKHILC